MTTQKKSKTGHSKDQRIVEFRSELKEVTHHTDGHTTTRTKTVEKGRECIAGRWFTYELKSSTGGR